MGEPSFPPEYFEVRFEVPDPPTEWPGEFGIVTGYATTGEVWPAEKNQAADQALRKVIEEIQKTDPIRITGYSPATGHAEPGWALAGSLDLVCDVGWQFRQDAIYWVHGDLLFVCHCAPDRRSPQLVGKFRERLDMRPGTG
jgi:hypothetical protein